MARELEQSSDDIDINCERYKRFISASPDYYFLIDQNGNYLDYYAAEGLDLYIPGRIAVGHNVKEFLPEDIAAQELYYIKTTLETGNLQVYEYDLMIHNIKKNFEARMVKAADNAVVVIVRDISVRRMMQTLLSYQSFYDPLTNLPNRSLFHDRLSENLLRLKRTPEKRFAVFYIGVDNLQRINDSLGHSLGDELLRFIAMRLKQNLRAHDTFARMSGDEFCVMIEDVPDRQAASSAAERLLAEFKTPFDIPSVEKNEVFTSISIGIALVEKPDIRADDMVKYADMAMRRAKQNGKNRSEFFSSDDIDNVREELTIQNELRSGIHNHEFRLFYQPILNLQTEEPVAFEALVRWQHPRRGLLTPFHFINIAEENGQLIEIGRWIIHEACRQLREWHDKGLETVISINVSPGQFKDPAFLNTLEDAMHTFNIEGRFLKLEITETLFFEFETFKPDFLYRLIDHGIKICIDDFGTGYSSFAYLKRFPVEYLKIDKSFVLESHKNENDLILTRSMIRLAASLGIDAIAEGIELPEHVEILRAEKCPLGQGYLYSRPVPPSEIFEMYS